MYFKKKILNLFLGVGALSIVVPTIAACSHLYRNCCRPSNRVVSVQLRAINYAPEITSKIRPSKVTEEILQQYFEYVVTDVKTTNGTFPVLGKNVKSVLQNTAIINLRNDSFMVRSIKADDINGTLSAELFFPKKKILGSVEIKYDFQSYYDDDIEKAASSQPTPAIYSLDEIIEKTKNNPQDFLINNQYYQRRFQIAKDRFKSKKPLTSTESIHYIKRVGYSEFGDTTEERQNNYLKVRNDSENTYQIDIFNKTYQGDEVLENQLDDEITGKQIFFNKDVIETLIRQNPYGRLPTSLVQLLSNLKESDYHSLLSVRGENQGEENSILKQLTIDKMLFRLSDRFGEIEIIFTGQIQTNGKDFIFSIKLDPTNSSLLKNEDYYRYIYDRSISLSYISTQDGEEASVRSGTGWIVDRIVNNNLADDEAEFLVATNNHVLNFSSFSSELIGKGETKEDKKTLPWRWFTKEEYSRYLNKKKPVLSEKEYHDKDKYRYLLWNTVPLKPNRSDTDDILGAISFANASKVVNITNENYGNRTWFLPKLSGKGVFQNDNVYKQIKSAGKSDISNGTLDLIISKMVLKKKDIKEKLPSLFSVLDTKNEAQWYTGLGNSQKYLPMVQNFRGGYNSNKNFDFGSLVAWKSSKGFGSLVKGFDRNVDEFNALPYYSIKKDNQSRIRGEDMPITNYFYNIGSRLITSQEIGMLYPGSSGSLVIDANFNPIGIHYAALYSTEYKASYDTQIANLFVAQSDDLTGDTDIRQSVINKLIHDNLYTYKLRPIK
ncbi:MAG2960 family serine endopeptidase lipoprotein [Ureaplasma canigenitalium]|uniref:MAG2960 family serine endopeptidase lipoprotein n=1 Tax=Ureaplasma canigenitalium TaxID=42092 RepID=UPI0004E132C4|nr:hypothetical protein [Ureaplasma canigenitalium]